MEKKQIAGYKAFNKDMTCRDFKYEEGKTYKTDNAKCCEEGFHFCVDPMDCWNYYDIISSMFHKVIGSGKFDKNAKDTKIASTEIKIGIKVSMPELVKASIDFIFKTKQAASGDYSTQAASGDSSTQAASGDYSKQAASGDSSKQILEGKNSVAMAAGTNSIIKGKKGCWITLAEWEIKNNERIPVCVKSAQIDGKKIKEDVWYKLKNGDFIEVES